MDIGDGAPAALVLGLGINGLGIVRALGRAGIRVIGVTGQPSEAGGRSRYCSKVHVIPATGLELVHALLALVGDEAQEPVLIPTGDAFAQLVADHHALLSRRFRFLAPDSAMLRRVNSKDGLIALLAEHGVEAPVTGRCSSLAQLHALTAMLHFPVLVKPADTFARPLPTGEKNIVFEDPDALHAWAAVHGSALPDMVFQEVVHSGDGHIWLCGLLLDAQSQPVLCASARKVRQYLPDYGITTLGVTETNPEIEAISRRLMSALGYRGICTLEFACDRRTGRHLLLEINPRTTYPNQLFTDAGVDFAQGLYRLVTDQRVPERSARQGVVWIDLARDLASFKRKRAVGKLDLNRWLRSVLKARSFAVLAADDPAPLLAESKAFAQNLGRQVLQALGLGRQVAGDAVTTRAMPTAARNIVVPAAAPELSPRNVVRGEQAPGAGPAAPVGPAPAGQSLAPS